MLAARFPLGNPISEYDEGQLVLYKQDIHSQTIRRPPLQSYLTTEALWEDYKSLHTVTAPGMSTMSHGRNVASCISMLFLYVCMPVPIPTYIAGTHLHSH